MLRFRSPIFFCHPYRHSYGLVYVLLHPHTYLYGYCCQWLRHRLPTQLIQSVPLLSPFWSLPLPTPTLKAVRAADDAGPISVFKVKLVMLRPVKMVFPFVPRLESSELHAIASFFFLGFPVISLSPHLGPRSTRPYFFSYSFSMSQRTLSS